MRTKGWQKVFSFTFVQFIKTKSFIIGTTIICVLVAAIAVLTNILPVLINNDDNNSVPGSAGGDRAFFSAVYLFDEPSILDDEDILTISEMLNGALFDSDKSFDELCEELKDTDSALAALKITAITSDSGTVIQYNIRTV